MIYSVSSNIKSLLLLISLNCSLDIGVRFFFFIFNFSLIKFVLIDLFLFNIPEQTKNVAGIFNSSKIGAAISCQHENPSSKEIDIYCLVDFENDLLFNSSKDKIL